jgi:hypothetical protein
MAQHKEESFRCQCSVLDLCLERQFGLFQLPPFVPS